MSSIIHSLEDNSDSKQALICIQHLLYDIHPKYLHNIAAKLAQEQSVPVETFGSAQGNWSWPVVERFLYERGYKCIQASYEDKWLLNSPSFLVKPGSPFIGFIESISLESFIFKNEKWSTSKADIPIEKLYSTLQSGKTYAVHKMWAPLEPFYAQNKPFHITTNESEFTRYECQPESCWRPEPVSYENRNGPVKDFMRAHKKSQILMSSATEMVVCKPTKNGFKSEAILRYESVNVQDAAEQVAEILADKIVERINKMNTGWDVMAHALHSAFYQLGGSTKDFKVSKLSKQQLKILRKYENGMYKKANEDLE